ncbi:hypothetical protein BCV69DRAFT_311443 [Microstroma glucosiphilum]|uniref:Monopolin complex subunit Csm1/Pcs1 C-terminal domain-containing protein n=1 Tax=Pseudomicrostroma glucosiphilum TaxID=1684307 RepID=A0A316U961_9BASI|nr:hypothetical protein BCV69DRAFT_311443 [Pseudomicrostroma glucosiphilum]PWN21712.1 hypothetical protein BCV69DRAFT_311443 [Pseudomicrostroma glucosiphilum]
MPAVASSRTASSSSSGHRATTTSRLAPSTASNRMDHTGHGDDDEEWDADDAARDSKIPRKTALPKKAAPATKSLKKPTPAAAALDLESDEDSPSSSPSARIASLESQVTRLRQERDTYLSQFAELKAVRSTAAETDLASYKKAAETRFRHSEDLVKSYKNSLDRAEKRLRGEMGLMGDEEREREEENERLRKEVETLKREKKKADEEARRLTLELRTEVESSRALLSNSKNGSSSSSGFNRDGDNQAVRRLYEDLTGIVISRIELCEREEGDDANSEKRRYTGAYAAVGHHDLQLSLEESTSTLPPSSSSSSSNSRSTSSLRKDLVFRPHLDSQRDLALLSPGSNLPEYLREEIRFDRGLSVKFLGTLEKGLKK